MLFVPLVPITIPASLHEAATVVAQIGMLIFTIYSLCNMGKRRPPYKTPRPRPWMFYPAYGLTLLALIDVILIQGRIPSSPPGWSPIEMLFGIVLVLVVSLLTQLGKQIEYNEKQQAATLAPEPC